MNAPVWGRLRSARYALPRIAGRVLSAPHAGTVARLSERLNRRGVAVTAGYFQGDGDDATSIVEANLAAAELLRRQPGSAYLSIKAPPLEFARDRLTRLAAAGLDLMFDAHAPAHADATLHAMSSLLSDFPHTGCVLPARWRRSIDDAARFRDTSAPIRLVKGEWADPEWKDVEVTENYLAIVNLLAGRSAKVAIATHQPSLAERALLRLLGAGTPCELEQLRGLPGRRTRAVARRLGVPIRVYVPFGPGWWPYAIDKALARPYLPVWAIHDALGIGAD